MSGAARFAERARGIELMDSAVCDEAFYRACLRDLAQVNWVTFGYRPTLGFLERLRRARRLPDRPIRIVDMASGYGDGLAKIAAWARRRGIAVHLTGIDADPRAVQAARDAHPGSGIAWICGDALAFDGTPDIVTSALFTHHLDDAAVVRFVAAMERTARIGWFVNDLHRHAVSYWGFTALAQVAGWHPFVKHDGPLSIARAFRRADWAGFLAEAGLAPGAARLEWWFPFRLCVSRVKPDGRHDG
jgi:2-polyprenyl-3-methyl-5-hydroxy-6-metoxy-1,4-benzoquinol methylase